MTEVELKDRKKSLEHKRNFGTILGMTAAAMILVGWASAPALLPGVLINGYYQGKLEYDKHGESWRNKWKKRLIFWAKDHHADHSGHGDGHGDSHAGGHGGGH